MDITIVDKNQDTFYKVMDAALKIPGVKVNREKFLRTELSKYVSSNIVENAIKLNPSKAGIDEKIINIIANSSINYETKKLTLISAAAGVPGGIAIIGTVSADLVQYFSHIIIIVQKLVYLYGWKDICDINGQLNDEAKDMLIIFMGGIFGVKSAMDILKQIATKAVPSIEKKIANKALTKGIIYPVVKKVSSIVGGKMTKGIFARGVTKIVPIVSAGLSGALTYASFKPMSIKFKDYLKELPLANCND